MSGKLSRFEMRLRALLQDFDFVLRGNQLVSPGIRGYPDLVMNGRFGSLLSAAEHLIPIIHDDHYYNRLKEITG